MKTALLVVFLGLCATAFAEDFDSEVSEAAASLTLLGALILLGVIFYLVYAGGILGGTAYNRNDYGYGQYQDQYGQYEGQYAQYRSNEGAAWEGVNILQWISVLQDMYANFDYNDLDCQKRMICEVMKEPEFYGSVARKFKNGFAYAKYLEANSRADQQKDCAEFFQCPFSIHDTMKASS